jgi:V8-like Glu-specific endopeptidase
VATSVAGGALAGTAQAEPDLKSSTLAVSGNAKAIAGYWTPSKLKSAQTHLSESTASGRLKVGASRASADGRPGVVAPIGEEGKSAGRSKNVNLPITVGKVFFIDDKGKERWCSGTSVQSKYRNLVATAGHCVYDTDTNKPFSNFVFIPGYYQGKAPWGIYVGAKVNMHHDFDVYEDYDYDYAFVNVYNGIKQTGDKEVKKNEYDRHVGPKYTVDTKVSKSVYEEWIGRHGGVGFAVDAVADQTTGPGDKRGVYAPQEVDSDAWKKAAEIGGPAVVKVGAQAYQTVEIVSKEEAEKYKADKKNPGRVFQDDKGQWKIEHSYVKRWIVPGKEAEFYITKFYVKFFSDAGRLGDNVGGQGFMWNQKLGKKVFTFGYPAYAHLDGHKPYSGHTMKWCYGTTGNAPDAPKYNAQEHQAIKCAFTPGASGSPFLLQYKNSKRTGYLNGVVSLTLDSDGNDRYDRVTTPYFNGETYAIYKGAANRWTGKLPL